MSLPGLKVEHEKEARHYDHTSKCLLSATKTDEPWSSGETLTGCTSGELDVTHMTRQKPKLCTTTIRRTSCPVEEDKRMFSHFRGYIAFPYPKRNRISLPILGIDSHPSLGIFSLVIQLSHG
jgi:hypothetical protein